MKNCILYVMGMDSTKYGGIERLNVALASSLREIGYTSVFVYESYPECEEFVNDLSQAGGTLIVCNSRRNKLGFVLRMAAILLKYKPIVVHAHFTKARFYALPLAHLMGIRRLYFTMHGEPKASETIKKHTFKWYQWANKKTQVITVSDRIKEQYLSIWPEASPRRVYLGVAPIEGGMESSRSTLGIPTNQTMVLTIANFNHIKGLDILCDAIEQLKNENRLDDVHFYIVGQPEQDMRHLDEIAQQKGIAPHLHLIGISNQVALYLTAANIYVQPSRSEGLPLTLMEAASAGLPLIGTTVGGIPEIIHHERNGILVNPEDSVQLADAINLMLQDCVLRDNYGKTSRVVYQNDFSIESSINHLIELYHIVP